MFRNAFGGHAPPSVATVRSWWIEKVDRVAVRTVSSADESRSDRARRWRSKLGTLHGWVRLSASPLAGFLLYLSSPPREWWWLAPIALAMFAAVIRGRRARASFGYGLLFGSGFLLPLLGWLLDFLGRQFGPWPWLGVCLVEALFFALAGAAMARVSRLPAWPVWAACVFVGVELLRSSLPFGGFPWGRLAFTQVEGILLPLASVGGTALVGFAVVLIGCGLAEAAHRLPRLRPRTAMRGLSVPTVVVVLPLVAAVAVAPMVGTAAQRGTAKVAVVQGNAPDVGLDLLYRDDVLHDNHIEQAGQLVADVRAGRVARPDFVLLPEQVGAWGPSRRDPALRRIARELGVPVIAGGLAESADGKLSNRIVRWGPRQGATEEYVKQHLVPFAEKIPLRSVAGAVSPFVRRFDRDMVPGHRAGVLSAGPAEVGVGICYDVAFDDVFREAARSGATLFAVPTNNAWYGKSEMSYQQLAMARFRAVEHGRAVAVAATSGVSAIVRPDGSVVADSDLFTERTMVADVPLRDSTTLATRLGRIPGWIFAGLGLAAVALTTRNRAHGSRRRDDEG